jgi:hypothetical protein
MNAFYSHWQQTRSIYSRTQTILAHSQERHEMRQSKAIRQSLTDCIHLHIRNTHTHTDMMDPTFEDGKASVHFLYAFLSLTRSPWSPLQRALSTLRLRRTSFYMPLILAIQRRSVRWCLHQTRSPSSTPRTSLDAPPPSWCDRKVIVAVIAP